MKPYRVYGLRVCFILCLFLKIQGVQVKKLLLVIQFP